MPATGPRRIPSYRRHSTGNAFVELSGRRIYLGRHGTPQSRRRYQRAVSEWLANGCELPVPPDDITIVELIARFWKHAETYYRKLDGTPTTSLDNYKQALRPLGHLYGEVWAVEFGPLALEAVRRHMIAKGWCRSQINKQIDRVRSVFKWAVAKQLIPETVYAALRTMAGLRAGRTAAPDRPPIKPVPQPFVDAIKPYLSRQVWALIELQQLTGTRAGELLPMRLMDLDTTGKIWLYKPADHKNAHHGHTRTIYIGPRGQEVLAPFLSDRPTHAPLFSPREAMEEFRAQRHAQRSTPLSCGNRPGSSATRNPQRQPRETYDVGSYRQAIVDACDRAFPPPPELARQRVPLKPGGKRSRWETPQEWKARLAVAGWQKLRAWQREHRWHPHQLRHNAATALRKEFGLETARIILGHRTAVVTEIYAEADREKALQVIAQVG